MSDYTFLSYEELRRWIVSRPDDLPALREWFRRTQHVRATTASEAARAST